MQEVCVSTAACEVCFMSVQVSKRGTITSRPDTKQSLPQQQQQAPQQPPQGPRRQQDSEEVPEIVNDRMLKRIITFSGIPVFVGFSLFPFFYFLKVKSCAATTGLLLCPSQLSILCVSNLQSLFMRAPQLLSSCYGCICRTVFALFSVWSPILAMLLCR